MMAGQRKRSVLALFAFAAVCLVVVDGAEMFSSIGKFGKGGGVLFRERETDLLLQADGPGVVNLIQFASDFPGYRETMFRFYYDGEKEATTETELYHLMQSSAEPLFGSNARGCFYLTVPIPFEKSIRITAQIHEDAPIDGGNLVYWTIRGSLGVPATVGSHILPTSARLHVVENSGVALHPLAKLDVVPTVHAANGALLAVQLEVESSGLDYLEGPVRMATERKGEAVEHMLGTGLDDYLTAAWWFLDSMPRYEVPGVAAVLRLSEPGHLAGHRIHSHDHVFWEDTFSLSFSNGDETEDGEVLGSPNYSMFTTRAWFYTWEDE